MDGQGKARIGRQRKRPAPKCAAVILGVCLALALALGPAAQAAERATPSGLPVPRYVTLKFAKVNARAGPGDDHRLMWVYHARGLPVQVVAETSEWRRVCDPRGGLAWVHRRVTDGKRAVANVSERPVAILKSPRREAARTAYLRPQAIASLVRCEKGWCKVKAGGTTGWTPQGDLWGVATRPQCR